MTYTNQDLVVFFSVIVGLVTGGFAITFMIDMESFRKNPFKKRINGALLFISVIITFTYSAILPTRHLLFFIGVGLINLAMIILPMYQRAKKMRRVMTIRRKLLTQSPQEIALPIPTEGLAHYKHHEPLVVIPNELFNNFDDLGGTKQEIPQRAESAKA